MYVMAYSRALKCKCLRTAFTLIELLVVISIIALLLAILMPSLKKAREQGKTVVCKSNLRQIGIAYTAYVLDNDNKFPMITAYGKWWSSVAPGYIYSQPPFIVDNTNPDNDSLGKYVGSPKVWWCPSFPKNYPRDRIGVDPSVPLFNDPVLGNETGYFYMVGHMRVGSSQPARYTYEYLPADVPSPRNAILMFDIPYTVNRALGERPIHRDGLHALLLDGHVEHRYLYYDFHQEIPYGLQDPDGWF